MSISRLSRLMTLAALGTVAFLGESASRSQPPEPAKAVENPDAKAIAALNASFETAFNAGDASAIAALMTEDAEVIDHDGTKTEGREAITAKFESLFASNPGLKITVKTTSLMFLTGDVAREEGTSVVTAATGALPEHEPTRYTVLFVKRDGKWLQASVKDHTDDSLTPHDHLKPLEWMVGDWVNENSDSLVSTHCEWADGENFLVRTFTVRITGKPALSGSQRIGWDPLTKQIKSWVFDTDGGHGEGAWTRQGDQWIIKANGVLRDGKVATATQVITYLNKDMIFWKTMDRTVGGNAMPDAIEFVMVRKPPEPK